MFKIMKSMAKVKEGNLFSHLRSVIVMGWSDKRYVKPYNTMESDITALTATFMIYLCLEHSAHLNDKGSGAG